MARLALGVEYNGSLFHGWQKQTNLFTVQGELEKAISKVANQDIELYCAGRTDAGVHALGQVAHFDTTASRSMYAWQNGINSNLPPEIKIRWISEVDPQFHARFSAISRVYQYVIYNHSVSSALLANQVTWYPYFLNTDSMRAASSYLLGEHDFSSFRSSECESKTPFRHVYLIEIKEKVPFIFIKISANAFLHHMVRNIVGVLLTIGRGRKPYTWAKEVLEGKNRQLAADTAQAKGLYFYQVNYPDSYQFPVPFLSIFG